MARLPISTLRPGQLYVDALSGHLVLVLEQKHTGPHTGNPAEVTTRHTLFGWYWNPTMGTHMRMELHDHQLMNAPKP